MDSIHQATRTPTRSFIAQRPAYLYILVIFTLFALGLRLHGVWNIGFFQDDSVSSSWLYEARFYNQGIFDYCFASFKGMVATQGRITPIYNFGVQPLVLALEENLLFYRIIQALAHVAVLFVFAAWLRRAGVELMTVFFSILVLSALYEIRDYHDAAFSQAITLPVTAFFGFWAMERAEALSARTTNSKVPWSATIAAGLTGLAAVLTHEFGLPFVLAGIFIVLLRARPFLSQARSAILVGAPAFLVIAFSTYLKAHSQYAGTSFGETGVTVVGATLLKQVTASFPLAYWLSNPGSLGAPSPVVYQANAILAVLGAGAVALSTWIFTAPRQPTTTSTSLFRVFATCSVLLLSAAGLTSFSLKYQAESQWGIGYAQTYVQYFCVAAIVASLVFKLAGGRFSETTWRKSQRAVARSILSVALGALFFVSFQTSIATADHINRHWRYPREVIALALEDFSKTHATPIADIVVRRSYLKRWENFYFLYQHTGWRGHFISSSSGLPDPQAKNPWLYLSYPNMVDSSDTALITISAPNKEALQPTIQISTIVYAVSQNPSKLETSYLLQAGDARPVPLRDFALKRRGTWYFARVPFAAQTDGIEVFIVTH